MTGTSPIFSVRPGDEDAIEGDVARPTAVFGQEVLARLRVRRDEPGALVARADGRYAITGRLLIVGSRDDLVAYLRRRIRMVAEDEQAWLQSAVGALVVDSFATSPASPSAPAGPTAGEV